MCSWKIILKTSGGGEWKEKNPLSAWQNCLESPLTSHCVLSVLPIHKSSRGYDIRHGVCWFTTAPSRGALKGMGMGGERQGITELLFFLAGNRQPGDGQHPFFSSWPRSTSKVMLFLNQLTATESFQASLARNFISLSLFILRTLGSFLSRRHSTGLWSIPHLVANPLYGPLAPTRQSSNADVNKDKRKSPGKQHHLLWQEGWKTQLSQQHRWETRFLAVRARTWWNCFPVILQWEQARLCEDKIWLIHAPDDVRRLTKLTHSGFNDPGIHSRSVFPDTDCQQALNRVFFLYKIWTLPFWDLLSFLVLGTLGPNNVQRLQCLCGELRFNSQTAALSLCALVSTSIKWNRNQAMWLW